MAVIIGLFGLEISINLQNADFYRYRGNMEHISDIVRRHRRVSGLSRVELAKIAGVGKTVVFDVEHQKPSIRYDTLLKILGALNISVHFDSPLIRKSTVETESKK